MKKMLLVLGLLFIGCRVLEPTDVVETSQESLMRSESVVGCKLAIVPDLPLMDGDSCPNYIFYVPHGTIWDEIRIPISYIAPARSLVEWNINWVQIPGELPPFHSYPNPRCRGEIEILIRPSYVGWSVSITADIGSEFDAIILTVLEENTIGEEGKKSIWRESKDRIHQQQYRSTYGSYSGKRNYRNENSIMIDKSRK